MSVLASAPGKLLLTGEYVVLEGAPALVLAVERRARVHLAAAAAFTVHARGREEAFALTAAGAVRFARPEAEADPGWQLVREVVGAAAAAAAGRGTALAPCALHLDTAAFALPGGGPKLGLGSSAALAVALSAALAAHAGELSAPPEGAAREALLARALAAHRAAQGGGSGAGVAASLWGGVVRVQRRDGGLAVARMPALPAVRLLSVWAGEPASTAAMLAQVAAFKARAATEYWALMEKLAAYAHAAAEFWALGNAAALMSIVDATHAALAALGAASGAAIVSPAHARAAVAVRAAGAHYKPSGAGGGDVGLAFCPSPAARARAHARLRGGGWRLIGVGQPAPGLALAPA